MLHVVGIWLSNICKSYYSKMLGLAIKEPHLQLCLSGFLFLANTSSSDSCTKQKFATENDFYSYPYMHISRVIKEISRKFQNQRPKGPTPVVRTTKPIF